MSFFNELLIFLKKNYYILIIAIISIIPLIITQELSKVLEAIIILLSHLTADIFMAMMIASIMTGHILKGYYLQLGGSIIFLLIGLYSLIFHNDAIYLIPSLIYFPVVGKNLYELKTGKKIKFINFKTLLIYAILLLIITIYLNNIREISTIIQFIGVLFFAVVLNIQDSNKMRIGGIITVSMMILGGVIKLYQELFILDIVNGATFSFTILPLVVLIGFIKNK